MKHSRIIPLGSLLASRNVKGIQRPYYQFKLAAITTYQSQRYTSQHNALVPTNEQKSIVKRFIPMTRKTLIRKLMETEHLVSTEECDKFFDFTVGLEASISQDFHDVLMELKQLYDPLNPDKETMMIYHVGAKQKQEQEFWLLQKLSDMLEKAHFEEISRKDIAIALDEHPAHEGVMVKVDMKKFDVLRFWALGEEEQPLSYNNNREWIRNKFYVMLNRWPETSTHYKRVVVAIRSKKQNKLSLKAFKDVPKNGLEYILPEGKMSISRYDKGFIATTVTIGALTVATRLLSSFVDYNLSWTSIVTGITGLLALNSWNAYKNKRNKYLVNLAKSFYFKTLANNRALLTLVVDRGEDEVFKAALLAYTFIRMENILKDVDADAMTIHMDHMITVNELNQSIESWMKLRHGVDISFDSRVALKHLEQLGLLKSQKLGKEVHLNVVSIEEALVALPTATQLSLNDRDEELDVEDIYPVTDNEKIDHAEKEKQKIAENQSPGWE